jgi:hypothetical protein
LAKLFVAIQVRGNDHRLAKQQVGLWVELEAGILKGAMAIE